MASNVKVWLSEKMFMLSVYNEKKKVRYQHVSLFEGNLIIKVCRPTLLVSLNFIVYVNIKLHCTVFAFNSKLQSIYSRVFYLELADPANFVPP